MEKKKKIQIYFLENVFTLARRRGTAMFRKAKQDDIAAVADIYKQIHEQESADLVKLGWLPNVYPVEQTAQDAYKRDDLFVCEEDGKSWRRSSTRYRWMCIQTGNGCIRQRMKK